MDITQTKKMCTKECIEKNVRIFKTVHNNKFFIQIKQIMIPVFVINLKKDRDRLQRTLKELDKLKITPEIFKGIHNFSDKKDIGVICYELCPSQVIGCGLSHINLAKLIVRRGFKHALILEDDIRVKENVNPQIFWNTIYSYTKRNDWDIVRFFEQGVYFEGSNKHVSLLGGSTAAYLLSRAGAKKVARMKISFHIDLQQNSLRTISGPQLFSTYDPQGIINIGNQNLTFYLQQPLIQVGGVNLCFWSATITVLVLFYLSSFLTDMLKYNGRCFLVAFFIAYMIFVSNIHQIFSKYIFSFSVIVIIYINYQKAFLLFDLLILFIAYILAIYQIVVAIENKRSM